MTLNTWQGSDGETKTGLNVAAWKVKRLGNIGQNRIRQPHEPDEDKPTLPIVLPAIRKKKRPAFGMFRKKKKDDAQDSADKSQDSYENGRPFDDALPF